MTEYFGCYRADWLIALLINQESTDVRMTKKYRFILAKREKDMKISKRG